MVLGDSILVIEIRARFKVAIMMEQNPCRILDLTYSKKDDYGQQSIAWLFVLNYTNNN